MTKYLTYIRLLFIWRLINIKIKTYKVDFKFYNESLADCIRIKPDLLDSLVEFSCDQTKNDTSEIIIEDHRLLRMLLEKAKKLRKLCIHHKINNADAALEDGLIINAPLDKLKLVGVSDRSLEIIFKLKSLKSLSLERSDEITNDGDASFIPLL